MIQEALEGGCYVLHLDESDWNQTAGERPLETVAPTKGAKALRQQIMQVEAGSSFCMACPHPETVLFFTEGSGQLKISGRRFAFSPNVACHIESGEEIEISPSSGPAKAIITSCLMDGENHPGQSRADFNKRFPDRTRGIDPELKEAMGDRFFQVMVDGAMGGQRVTCFIGEIPKSKAPSHFHLYEETIFVLAGHGRMWTGDMSVPVQAGDIIYLPRKQEHSLECTADEGLRVCGIFYPAGSPAENY